MEESKIYCRGEKLKEEIANSPAFQYEQSIEQIWEGILEKLGVDSEQILRESDIHSKHFKILEKDSDTQPTTETEQDRITPSASDVWPQRSLGPFDALRHRAAKSLNDASLTQLREDGGGKNALYSSRDDAEVESTLLEDASLTQLREDGGGKNALYSSRDDAEVESTLLEYEEDYDNKYNLAMQFAQEYGIDALEQGIVGLIKDQDDPDYDFTEDETNMLLVFQDALKKCQTQSEPSTEAVDGNSTVDDETSETNPTPKPVRANAKVTEEQVREIRARREAGESYSKLAKEFGLTSTGVRDIALRNTWKHVE